MQVAVSKRDLLRTLGRCQGVADKKSTMPVLGNVLIEVVGPDQLRLAATDLFLSVSSTIHAEVDKGGSIAVGARDLFERVKYMPEGQVTITSTEAGSITLRASGSARRYTLHGIPGDEFPALPQSDGASSMSMSVDTLQRLIATTIFSISSDETRLHLNSALFEWEGDRVRMVTTDGHRLSKMELPVAGRHGSTTMLIPNKGVQELKRLCDEAKSESRASDGDSPELAISQSGPNAFFKLAGFQFSVKLVDAQFPPYHQVIPSSTERSIVVPRAAVMDALKAVRVAASDRTGGVKMSTGLNLVRFASESPESGEGFDEVSVDYDGPEMTIGFNAQYFLDVLAAIDAEEITIGLSGELDPVLLKPCPEPEGTSYVAVVMPMRI